MISSNVLNNTVANIGGVDAAMDACDRMYSATFRSSQEIKFSDLHEEEQEQVLTHHRETVFFKHTGIKEPEPTSDAFDDDAKEYAFYAECDKYHDTLGDWIDQNSNISEIKINSDDLCTYLCNYKGEGEHYVLVRDVIKFHVFIDKSSSFFQTNSL